MTWFELFGPLFHISPSPWLYTFTSKQPGFTRPGGHYSSELGIRYMLHETLGCVEHFVIITSFHLNLSSLSNVASIIPY